MIFNSKHHLFLFSRIASFAKQWGLGLTVAEAAHSTARSPQRDPEQKTVPGTYGVLVGFGQHH